MIHTVKDGVAGKVSAMEASDTAGQNGMSGLAPVELVVAVLCDPAQGDDAVQRLLQMDWDGTVELLGLALLHKGTDNRISLQDPLEKSSGTKATFLGALAGGALGLWAGPMGVMVGAAAGATACYMANRRSSTSAEHLQALAQELPPGHAGLLVLIEHESVEAVQQVLSPFIEKLARFVMVVEPDDGRLHVGGYQG